MREARETEPLDEHGDALSVEDLQARINAASPLVQITGLRGLGVQAHSSGVAL